MEQREALHRTAVHNIQSPPIQNVTIQQAFEIAVQHHQSGRLAEAEAIYRQILVVDPGQPEALHLLGLIANHVGRNDVASDLIQQAIAAAAPEVSSIYFGNLAWVRFQLGDAAEAEKLAREALRIEPGAPNFHNTLGNALYLQGRITEAAASFAKAFELDGANVGALSNWANVLLETGQVREAIAAHRQATEIDPQGPAAWDNYLRDLGFLPDLDPQFIRAEHEKWAAVFLRTLDPALVRKRHKNDRDTERRLNVGFLSADFRLHSVAYFIEPLLRHLNRENFSLFCYASVASPDDVTVALQRYPASWRSILGQSDEQAAEQIVQDGIDILIDLGGHTSQNRCRILALRPAPVQMTYLGYPFTIGMEACDYRLTDAVSDPPGKSEDHYTEKLLRLPISSWCFEPPKFDVPVAPPPHERNGCVTFGSFNTYNKLNDAVLDAWGQIMAGVPTARLFIKSHGLNDPGLRSALVARLQERGIGEDRITIKGREPKTEAHLALYADVDIALDTFPYNGTTTTCEALWQGVPVVGLEGHMHVARVGQTLHRALGLDELIGRDSTEYVNLAVKLAHDAARIRDLRRTLRERMLRSPLCDQVAFVRHFEEALRGVWRRRCETCGEDA
jgi:predicted O-linked N-acetylglucosamine transferase (SPINDLY family)